MSAVAAATGTATRRRQHGTVLIILAFFHNSTLVSGRYPVLSWANVPIR
jgi:hypothetical protein